MKINAIEKVKIHILNIYAAFVVKIIMKRKMTLEIIIHLLIVI